MELLLDAGNETGIVLSWLRKEDDLRGRLDARPVAAQPGLMAVDVAIAAAITVVGVLARSLCRYLEVRERHRGADLELHVTRPGGEKVRVVLTRGEDATALVTRLLGTPAEETDATPRP
ncbi:effector-associated constant component EACC1 [Amycolatopsis sp. NPDC003865]